MEAQSLTPENSKREAVWWPREHQMSLLSKWLDEVDPQSVKNVTAGLDRTAKASSSVTNVYSLQMSHLT